MTEADWSAAIGLITLEKPAETIVGLRVKKKIAAKAPGRTILVLQRRGICVGKLVLPDARDLLVVYRCCWLLRRWTPRWRLWWVLVCVDG